MHYLLNSVSIKKLWKTVEFWPFLLHQGLAINASLSSIIKEEEVFSQLSFSGRRTLLFFNKELNN